jgi:NDP-hexose-3-ketoreductase
MTVGGAQQVRVGVWGLGPHARKKVLPAIVACPRTRLAGVTSRNLDVARSEGDRFACQVWSRPDEMLSSAEVDAVYVATPIGVHYAQGKDVLSAGKHLWCEKSLATRSAEVAELATLSRSRMRSLCEAFMYAYHPQFLRIVDLVTRERALGSVMTITSRFTMPVLQDPRFRHSRDLGGGALLDVACYPLSLALRLAGEAPRVLTKRIGRSSAVEVDVSGHALLEFPSGTMAFLDWGFGYAYANEARVHGEHGSVYADRVFTKPESFAASIEISDARGARRTEGFPPTNSFVAMLDTFAAAAADGDLQERLRREAELQAAQLEALAVS